jgi:hypothetical protein
MARLLIAVEDPLGYYNPSATNSPSLLLGSFLRVHMRGKIVKGVIPIPRTAIENYNSVWIFREGKLEKHTVDIVWSEKEYVYVQDGVSPGDKLVISDVPGMISGMKVSEVDNEQ